MNGFLPRMCCHGFSDGLTLALGWKMFVAWMDFFWNCSIFSQIQSPSNRSSLFRTRGDCCAILFTEKTRWLQLELPVERNLKEPWRWVRLLNGATLLCPDCPSSNLPDLQDHLNLSIETPSAQYISCKPTSGESRGTPHELQWCLDIDCSVYYSNSILNQLNCIIN